MYVLATLHQLHQRLNLSAGAEDARLLAALNAASAQLERLAGRCFSPRLAQIDHSVDVLNSTELLLDDDLLQLNVLQDAAGTISLDDTLLLPDDDVAGVILLTSGRTFTWALTPKRAVRVTGLWGWHDDPARMWRLSGDTVCNNPLSSSATMLTVTDATAADAMTESPRFQVGQLLKIGDEFVRVLAIMIVGGGDDTLTVERGANGTTAASHAQGTAIYTYQPPADVTNLVLAWASWLYHQPDYPPTLDMPESLRRDVEVLRRVGVKV